MQFTKLQIMCVITFDERILTHLYYNLMTGYEKGLAIKKSSCARL